jgi:TRAP-type C4-dicarboxylate transport system substrate-binding protein
MKKRMLFIPFVLTMACSVLLIGPGNSTLVNNCEAASSPQFVWKMHQWRPATQDEIPYMQLVCDQILKRSKGRLKIDIYPGFSLGYHRSSWLRDIKSGVIDITCIYNPFTAGEEPSFNVIEMPQIWKSRSQALLAANALCDFKKKVYKEIWGGEMLAQGTILESGSEVVFTKNKAIKSIADMKGLKIRVPGGRYRELYTKLGAAPQSIKLGEVYMAMKTGVIDGLRTGSGSVYQLKLYEVANKALLLGSWPALSQDIVVSNKAWSKIPPDLQEIVREEWQKWGAGMMAHVVHGPDVDEIYWRKKNEEQGMEYGKMPEKELAQIRKIALGVLTAWVEKEGGRVAEAYEIVKPFIVPQTKPGKPTMFYGFEGD